VENEDRICSSCGAKLGPDDSSCPRCGRLYVDSRRARLYAEPQAAPPPPPLKEAETPSAPPEPASLEPDIMTSKTTYDIPEEVVETAESTKEVPTEPTVVEPPMKEDVEIIKPVKSMVVKADWPSPSLVQTISELGVSEITIDAKRPEGVHDVTTEAREQIKEFAPEAKLLGFDMRGERKSNTWGGVLVRALENPSGDTRCLQYVYVYTFQRNIMSLFWTVVVPLMMLIWTFFVPFIFSAETALLLEIYQTSGFIGIIQTPGQTWVPILATGFVGLPLFFTGLWPHLAEAMKGIGSRFRFRATSPLVILGAMMWFAVFTDIALWIMIIVWAICLFVWRTSPTHKMDYVPVFVWIKKEGDQWEFDSASWDYFHYFTDKRPRTDLENEGGIIKGGKRIQLLMDNPWHSMFLGSRELKIGLSLLSLSIIGLFVSLGALPLLVITQDITTYPWVWLFIGFAFLLVATGSMVARFPFNLIEDMDEYVKEEAHLTDDKLRILWNLGEKEEDSEARFVIVTKMQEPFNLQNKEGYYVTFRDKLE
jgi:hypothetical protein